MKRHQIDLAGISRWMLCVFFISLCGSVHAGLVHSQQPNLTSPGNTGITTHYVANDFTLGQTTQLSSFRVWLYGGSNFVDFNGTLGWGIFDNTGSSGPGTLLFSGQDLAPSHSLFDGSTQLYEVDASFGSGVTLGPGSYWFAIHEGAWGSGSDGSLVSYRNSTTLVGLENRINFGSATDSYGSTNGFDNAFELFDATAVPEPSAFGLLSLLGCCVAARRRRESMGTT